MASLEETRKEMEKPYSLGNKSKPSIWVGVEQEWMVGE